jgi:hypothetical protein
VIESVEFERSSLQLADATFPIIILPVLFDSASLPNWARKWCFEPIPRLPNRKI